MALGRWYRDWRRRRWLREAPLAPDAWRRVLDGLPWLDWLDADGQARLGALSALFVREKQWFLREDLDLDDHQRLLIAAQACLPILNLGLEWYRGWHSLVIYPGSFLVPQEYHDAAGVVHRSEETRAGEAWRGGPMVLSWEDVVGCIRGEGYNVIIHECSHKLDMLNGEANGRPPLHREMSARRWAAVFSAAFEALEATVARGEESFLDPYGAEGPAEFFAVASEAFFTIAGELRDEHPDLYRELAAFYRQDPATQRPA